MGEYMETTELKEAIRQGIKTIAQLANWRRANNFKKERA
jgi:hypothetical protein